MKFKFNLKEFRREKLEEGIFRVWLLDEKVGSNNFFLRFFEILPGRGTEDDKHPYEHGIYILEGIGELKIDDEIFYIEKDDVVFIPSMKSHSIKNIGDKSLKFLCIVPAKIYRDYKKEKINAW